MTDTLDGSNTLLAPPAPCAHVTGILFSRKPCNAMTSLRCARCQGAVCEKHARLQSGGERYCHACDAYVNDDREWSSNSSTSYRDRDRYDATPGAAPVAAGVAGGMAAGTALGDDDRAGLVPGDSWHGGAPPEGDAAADDAASDDAGFDAS